MAGKKYICQQCGYETISWLGRCPNCQAWNSLVEIKEEEERGEVAKLETFSLAKVKELKVERIKTSFSEVDRVLGGGLVTGSGILLAGDPGIGKSTLLLQIAAKLTGKVVYVSAEESVQQIKIRSQRLKAVGSIEISNENNIESIISFLKTEKPNFLIIDSIQTVYSSQIESVPGSLVQVRECARKLLNIGKRINTTIIFVGHVTKEGAIAGPMVLEHLVDVVLFFEGERFQSLRLLRSTKNRFGPTDEVGVFEMKESGFIEVNNPSKIFLEEKKEIPGSAVVAAIEGTRPILVEIQALVVPCKTPYPRRVGRGIDYNRLLVLVAVIEKRLRLPLGNFDIYVNVVGGIKVAEPAADLGICLAIISSFKNLPLAKKTVSFGEVGLLGEIRQASYQEKRTKEAKRLGFTNILSAPKFTDIVQALKIL